MSETDKSIQASLVNDAELVVSNMHSISEPDTALSQSFTSPLIRYESGDSSVSPSSILSEGILSLSLEGLCNVINSNPALATCQVATASCYAQFSSVVKHRFVLLKIVQPGERDFWLRMDRRTDPHAGILGFVRGFGTTASNDVVRQCKCSPADSILKQPII